MNDKRSRAIRSWLFLMKLGAKTGCHQRADRSLYFHGFQFPICARCTGILIGYISALLFMQLLHPSYGMCVLLNVPMFIDGMTQYKKYRESKQIIRVITGILGGYGILSFQIKWLMEVL